jgi:hypothetical protein
MRSVTRKKLGSPEHCGRDFETEALVSGLIDLVLRLVPFETHRRTTNRNTSKGIVSIRIDLDTHESGCFGGP